MLTHCLPLQRNPLILFLACSLLLSAAVAAPQEKVLYRFKNDGSRGAYPASSLIFDKAGNLYGTAPSGGPAAAGVIFKLAAPATKGAPWQQTILHSFAGEVPAADGPYGNLVMDKAGNLYGTTLGGGSVGWGFVFELSPPVRKGEAWKETVLYSFQGGTDGGRPYAGLIFDRAGNLYGTTSNGGLTQNGTVFQLSRQGRSWKETVLHTFGGAGDALVPTAALVMDGSGNLFGTTLDGGSFGLGAVFEMVHPATPGSAWTENVIYSFCHDSNCTDGANPWGGLALDAKGKLYGTSYFGGGNDHCGFADETCGTVFRLAPPTQKGGRWIETVLTGFASGGTNGFFPWSTPILDSRGNVYATTELGGFVGSHCNFGCGVVFKLAPPKTRHGSWTEIILHKFMGQIGLDEGISTAGLVTDRAGHFFGTTSYIQTTGVGTVFEVIP